MSKFKASIAMLTLFGSLSVIAADNAGKTIMTRGDVFALDSQQKSERSLKRRDPIFNIDKVVTKDNGRAQFAMVDGGLLSIKPNSEVLISTYSYDPESKEGSAVIELVKGGLRSISGQIKKHGGDYQVKTPVGSIGIRGTHYELAIVDGEMFIAVWDGAVDLTPNSNSQSNEVISFGPQESYSYGKVTEGGEVTQLLQAPSVFNNKANQADTALSGDTVTTAGNDEGENLDQDDSIEIVSEADISDNEIDVFNEQQFITSSQQSLAESLSSRTGEFTYGTLARSGISSTLGNVTDFGIAMTVNFDNGTVSDGELSAVDSGGEWYAAFSGFIDVTALDLAVTFASHGNERAEGSINGIFTDDGDSITGDFELNEVVNPNNKLNGFFVVK